MSENGTDFRSNVREDLARIYPAGIKALEDAIDARKKKWTNCPHCKKAVQVEVHDTQGLVKAMQFLAEQGHGKPPETLEIKLDLERDLERWRGYIEEMTDEERQVMTGFLRRHMGAREQQALPAAEEGSSAPETPPNSSRLTYG